MDTRPLHRQLFGNRAPEVAGLYRGTPARRSRTPRAPLSWRAATPVCARDPCPEPWVVGPAMAALGDRIGALWDSPARGDAAFDALAGVTHGFLAIHPYLDGNGHIYRLMAITLAPRFGLTPRADFTLHPRPYDHLMSLGLQWFPDHPGPLSAYLRRWFIG